jgi:hypothetical protein
MPKKPRELQKFPGDDVFHLILHDRQSFDRYSEWPGGNGLFEEGNPPHSGEIHIFILLPGACHEAIDLAYLEMESR